MFFSPAGRDDADDFFAMTVLSISVDDQEDSGNLRFNLSCANRMPPLFSRFVHAVQAYEAAFVFEDQRGQLE